MPSDDYLGVDPVLVRQMTARMRTTADVGEDVADELSLLATSCDLADDLAYPTSMASEITEELRLAADEFDRRAHYVELLDAGAIPPEFGAIVESIIDTSAETLDESLADGVGAGTVLQHSTDLDEFEDRFVASTETWPSESRFCATQSGYLQGGALVGPDGDTYEVVAPYAVIDGESYNADWGEPEGPAIGDLMGADPGWTTVSVESGFGQAGDGPSGASQAIVILGGLAGAPYDAYYSVAGRPAEAEVYAGLQVDASFAPVAFGDARARPAGVPPDPEDPNIEPSTALNALTLVNQGLTGIDAAQSINDADNVAYAAEYQVNDDGRRRVMIHTYQLSTDDEGNVGYVLGYGGGSDGALVGIRVLNPRINDDGHVAPPEPPGSDDD